MIKKTIGSFMLGILVTTSLNAAELYSNFNGYHTPDRKLSQFSAMAVENNKVLATGTYDELIKKYPNADKIDLKGKTLLPGLIDGHGHVASLGLSLLRVSLRETVSEADSVNEVIAFAKENPQLSWITGHGWNQELWSNKKFPTKKSLDEKLPKKPVLLSRVDGHALWANSAALEAAGITKDTVSPEGGEIVKDNSGEPTGVLIDNAMYLMESSIPPSSLEDVTNAIKRVGKHFLSLGITSTHDAGIDKLTYDAYNNLANTDDLPIRIYAMLSVVDDAYPEMLDKGIINSADDMLAIRSVKISADGALGSRGAAMIKPYSDDIHNHGLLLHTPKSLKDNMVKAVEHGFQANVHAIGDKANNLALNYFDELNKDEKSKALRHRIEHAQVIQVSDLVRFKEIGILPSMQPTHATSDMNMAEARVGKERLKGAYAWRTFLKDDVRIVSGSDFPIEYANPFFGLHAAVTRQNRDNQPELGWIPAEAMTLAEALRSFTLDAAYGAHQDKIIGTLEAGKWADFIVIDQNIFNQPATELWKPKVLGTWLAGKKVYSAE